MCESGILVSFFCLDAVAPVSVYWHNLLHIYFNRNWLFRIIVTYMLCHILPGLDAVLYFLGQCNFTFVK